MMTVPDIASFYIEQGCQWIRSQRALYYPDSHPIPSGFWRALENFFDPVTLRSVHLKFLEQMPNPPFYDDLLRQGTAIPFDFSTLPGITFQDVIILPKLKEMPEYNPLINLFHKTVHVVQYSMLGVPGFVEKWVVGFFSYNQIYERVPLEADAIELAEIFEGNPDLPFSVENVLLLRLKKRHHQLV